MTAVPMDAQVPGERCRVVMHVDIASNRLLAPLQVTLARVNFSMFD